MTKLSEMPLRTTPKKEAITQKTQIRTIVEKIEVSDTMRDIFKSIDENLNKTWGIDNNYYLTHGKPKYKNMWKEWMRFKKWFESELLNK